MRRYLLLLLVFGLIGSWMIYTFVPQPKYPELRSAAEFFHQLIEPYPPVATMCAGTTTEELPPDQATYRLEVRLVTIPFGVPPSPVPPLSGYLNDISFFQFMEGVQGDVRCSTLMCPACTLSDAKSATISSGAFTIQVKKTNDHLLLNYTQPSGITYTQEFDLPEGITFVTNLGEQSVRPCRVRVGPSFPSFLSFLDPLFTRSALLQEEMFLLLKYTEIETNAVSSPLSPGGRGVGGEGEQR
jgi:hypothetical protein